MSPFEVPFFQSTISRKYYWKYPLVFVFAISHVISPYIAFLLKIPWSFSAWEITYSKLVIANVHTGGINLPRVPFFKYQCISQFYSECTKSLLLNLNFSLHSFCPQFMTLSYCMITCKYIQWYPIGNGISNKF